MSSKKNYCEKEINQKQALLENAKKILKQEFVGIDTVIDKVIDSLATWYLFPELQDRPVIINLWGMTGVGKTALVVRLAKLLDYDKKLFRYDMGNNSSGYTSLKELLKGVFQHNNGIPYMIMLDEFQYAKTKNEDEREIDNHFSRVIWDLLDSGKFQSARDIDRQIGELVQCKQTLKDCLAAGVGVSNGLVTKNRKIFVDMLSYNFGENDYDRSTYNHNTEVNGKTACTFLPNHIYQVLHQCLWQKNLTVIQFKKMISRMDGPQIIELLNKAIELSKSNKWVDCTKTVIFILGNLDDAYTMSSTLNPDINANEFHDASRLININHIKRALKRRFRYEQISRLGNNHIIYPAFSEDSFKKIIELELSKISLKTLKRFDVKLIFAESFKSLIYREGVFATQGTRPLFSTIYNLVNTKIPMLIAKDLLNNNCADSILFAFDKDHVNYEFSRNDRALYNIDDFIQLSMETLRTPAKDDMQAITAVHESGHAVVAMKALKIIPEYICSTSADVSSRGFTLIKNKWKYFGKEEVIPRIANLLGGIVAERIIFGDNKLTTGSEQDIELATNLAAKSIKDYGMGSLNASINIADYNSKYSYHEVNGEYNHEVKVLLQAAYMLAENMLLSEKNLLLKIADHLSNERFIKKDRLERNVRKYGSNELKNVVFIEEGDNLYYRNELKSQVEKISNLKAGELKPNTHDAGEMAISLNKTA